MSLSALPKDTLIQIFSHLRPSESKLAATCRTARNAYVDFCDRVLKITSDYLGSDSFHALLIEKRLFTHREIDILHDHNAKEYQKVILRKRFPQVVKEFFEKPETLIKEYKCLFFSRTGQNRLNLINEKNPDIYSPERLIALKNAITLLDDKQETRARNIELFFQKNIHKVSYIPVMCAYFSTIPLTITLVGTQSHILIKTSSLLGIAKKIAIPITALSGYYTAKVGFTKIGASVSHLGTSLLIKAEQAGKATGRFFANCCKSLKII